MDSNIAFHKKAEENLPNEYTELYEFEDLFLKKVISKGMSVCDIGCGGGRTINSIVGITDHIIGVDYDEEAIKEISKRYPQHKFIVADAVSLPFPDDSFDFITCMMSRLNFGDKKLKSLNEMSRVLKENGKLVLSTFSEYALPVRMKVYEEIGIKIKEVDGGKVIFDQGFGANTSEQFTKEELTAFLRESGFKIISIDKAGVGYVCYAELG